MKINSTFFILFLFVFGNCRAHVGKETLARYFFEKCIHKSTTLINSPSHSALTSLFQNKINTDFLQPQNNMICTCNSNMGTLNSMEKGCSMCAANRERTNLNLLLLILMASLIITIIISTLLLRRKQFQKKQKKTEIEDQIPYNLTDSIKNETELQILDGLKNFEEKLRFIQKGMTLGNLATELGTNVKYLSAIIKKYKGDSFKSYINRLRIDYIIHKIDSDPLYRKYKISHLAELSGFTTSSAFAKIFKDIIGIKPSEYIFKLQEPEK